MDYRIKDFLHLEAKCKVRAEKTREQGRPLETIACGYWIQLLSTAVPMIFSCTEDVFADAVLPKGETTVYRAGLILILVMPV